MYVRFAGLGDVTPELTALSSPPVASASDAYEPPSRNILGIPGTAVAGCNPLTACFWSEIGQMLSGNLDMATSADDASAINALPPVAVNYPGVPDIAYNPALAATQTPAQVMAQTAVKPIDTLPDPGPSNSDDGGGGNAASCTTVPGTTMCVSTLLLLVGVGFAAAILLPPLLAKR